MGNADGIPLAVTTQRVPRTDLAYAGKTGCVEGSARRARAVFAGSHTHRVPTDGQDRFDAGAVPVEFAAEGIGIAYVRDAGIAGGVEGSALFAEVMRANLSVGGTASPKQSDCPTQGGPCEQPASL